MGRFENKITKPYDYSFLRRFLSRRLLLQNTFWMLGGRGVRLVLQAVYFFLIARALGASQYGVFVGAVALVALLSPFSSWGTGFLLMKEVARDRATFRKWWGSSLGVTLLSGTFLLGVVFVISHLIWTGSVPETILLLVGISDLVVVRMVDLATQAFMAVEVLRKSAEVNVVLSGARALGAVYFAFFVHHPTAGSWSLLYLLSGLVGGIYSATIVSRLLGSPQWTFRLSRREIKDGLYFAVSQASQTAYNDIDKTMLVRLGGLEATGIYGAAYRIVDVSFAPISALVYATFSRFFRHGERGLGNSVRYAQKLMPYAASYGFCAALLLFVTAPVLPLLLGKGFALATLALRWLSPLVFLKSIHYFLANSLSTSGAQGITAMVQTAVAAINVFLNLWLIPAYSWRGAAWASLACDSLLTLGLFGAIVLISRRRPALLMTEIAG